jgi:exopolysaccharide production protein ExoQ
VSPPPELPSYYSTFGMEPKRSRAPFIGLVDLATWVPCFISIASLLFVNLSQTLAVFVFLVCGVLPALIFPKRAAAALLGDWLPWLFVALAIISISWSEAPDFTTRFAIELVLTVAVALVLASVVQPHLFLSVLMCSYLLADLAGLFVGRFALNAGAMAMIGIFGSKNAFSGVQAYLFLASFWVLLSREQSIWVRSLALIGVLVSPFLLVAGRSADSIAPLMLVVPTTFLLFLTNRFPPLSRALVMLAGGSLIAGIFALAYVFRDELFGQLLIITGKDVTLSGREYLWVRAAELIDLKPILGRGYSAFWVQGNPYAEDIWAHFQVIGRGGFNFHNQWYDMGVSLGYVGVGVALLTVLVVNIRVFWWMVRNPSPESFFFIGFVWIVDMRSFLESESFSHFSISWILFIMASYYARIYAASRNRMSEDAEMIDANDS